MNRGLLAAVLIVVAAAFAVGWYGRPILTKRAAHMPPADCWNRPIEEKSNRCALHFYWRACDLGSDRGCDEADRLRTEGVTP